MSISESTITIYTLGSGKPGKQHKSSLQESSFLQSVQRKVATTMQTSSPGTKQPATREDTARDQTDPKKNPQAYRQPYFHSVQHWGDISVTKTLPHYSMHSPQTVMEACSPSPETVKALDVTSFTVNLFSKDEILALQSKATSAKNFAVLPVQHDCVQAF